MTIGPATPRPRSPARNPLDMIAMCHEAQAEMCDALEHIADGLPDDIDRRLCARLAGWLQFDLALHHHDEEEALFPLLRKRAHPQDRLDMILERLASEHSTDMDLASDIAEELASLAQGHRPANPEMLGYMLRGFFEAYRRHVHWENALLMPLARQRLTLEDLELLQARLDEIRTQAV
jgi:hemerythrin-like domain-containing protein